MMNSFIISFFFSLSLLAQNSGNYEYSSIENLELSEFVLTECAPGKKPCYPGQPQFGCVRSDLGEKAFKKACNVVEEEYKKFVVDCYINTNGQSYLLAVTTTQNACNELKSLWTEVWTSPNNIILQKKFPEGNKRVLFFQNTLLAKRSNRDKSLTKEQVDTNKRGKIYSENNKTLRSRIMGNLADYQEILKDSDCGPGILPGIDKVPVLDQNSQGTCYAHATSSMIDYVRRFKMGGQQPTYGSPLMAAIDFKLADNQQITTCENPFSSGLLCRSYNSQVKNGFCDTEDIEKAIIKSFTPYGKTKKTSWYMAWARNKIAFDTTGFRIQPNDHVLDYLYVIGSLYEEKKWDELKRLWISLEINGNQNCENPENDILQALQWNDLKLSSSLEKFYVNYFNGLCKREKLPFNTNCKEKGVPSSSTLDKWIAEGYPLGLSYCSALLSNRNFKSKTRIITQDEACGPHASLIVGTARDNKGRCAYVVRNSWGKSCNYYDKDFDCKDGNIYVPKDLLLKNTFDIQKISVE